MKHHYLKNKNFNSHFNMEDVMDKDYVHGKKICKDFEIKTLGQ